MDTKSTEDEMAIKQKIKNVYTPGRTKEEVRERYNSWAETYENDQNPNKYEGPVLAVNECCDVIPEKNRASVLVLDVAAGTGFLGNESKLYYSCTREVSEISMHWIRRPKRAKNVYEKFINEFMSEKPLQIYADTYGIIVSSGGMGQNHIPAGAFWEMLRITRKGGYIIWSMREEFLRSPLYDGILEVLIDSMEESGKLCKIKKSVIPNYYEEKQGAVFVLKKT